MSSSALGLLAGLLLALVAVIGGPGGFLLALVLGAIGFALGAHRDGSLDLGQVLRSPRG